MIIRTLHLNLSKHALPSLRILSACSLDLIFHNIEGARNLTYLKLFPVPVNSTKDLLAQFHRFAKHLVSVKTFACSLFYTGAFNLAGMMPNLERLDIHLQFTVTIDSLVDENPGTYHDIEGDVMLKNLKMLRVTSVTMAHSDAFVLCIFKRFPSLRSLEVPYMFEDIHHVDEKVLYRFANATDMPSIVRWECKRSDEWLQDWHTMAQVPLESRSLMKALKIHRAHLAPYPYQYPSYNI